MQLAIAMAISGNHMATVWRLYTFANLLFTETLGCKLAWADCLSTLKVLRSLSPPLPLNARALTFAVMEGHSGTADRLFEQNCPINAQDA